MFKRIITLTLLIGLPALYVAQGFYSRNNWKNRKNEFAIGGGISNCLTDLGGGKSFGRDLTPLDLNFKATKFGLTLEYNRAIARKWTWRTNFVYGKINGDDNYTISYRKFRGVHFNSQIVELSTVFIHHFSKERIGHLYSLRNTRGTKLGVKPLHLGWYIFGGVGGFHFNPQAVVRNPNPWGLKGGELYNLQSLHTEGQASPYSLYNVCLPVGFGARHSINGDTGLKIEFGYRFTFTDYLDDTSTKYPEEKYMIDTYGNAAAYFSNPSKFIPGQPDNKYYADQIRGNSKSFKERDGYMFLMLTFYFNRDPRHWFDDARRSAIKVRRPKASF